MDYEILFECGGYEIVIDGDYGYLINDSLDYSEVIDTTEKVREAYKLYGADLNKFLVAKQ